LLAGWLAGVVGSRDVIFSYFFPLCFWIPFLFVWEKKTCTEFGVLISWEELGWRKNQLGRIGLEIRSVGKNWVRGKISGEELGSRKH
jgi:hypothetical protein